MVLPRISPAPAALSSSRVAITVPRPVAASRPHEPCRNTCKKEAVSDLCSDGSSSLRSRIAHVVCSFGAGRLGVCGNAMAKMCINQICGEDNNVGRARSCSPACP